MKESYKHKDVTGIRGGGDGEWVTSAPGLVDLELGNPWKDRSN